MEKVVIKQCKLLFILFVGLLSASVASAQSERFLWEVHSPHILSISQRTMDSVGNLYVAGVFESQAEINGQYICPADTDAWLFASRGVFIAKFDTAGTMLWCRSVKDWKEGSGNVCGCSINNEKISFSFTYGSFYLQTPQDIYLSNRHCWLHFIDTTYYGFIDGVMQPYGTLPYRNSQNTYLVTLDLDGNRLDIKFAHYLSGRYRKDSKGNHYILFNQQSPRPAEGEMMPITLNDDTSRLYRYPVSTNNFYPYEKTYRDTPFLIKINPKWSDMDIIQLTDSLNGYRNNVSDTVFCSDYGGYDFTSFEIDEEDYIYAVVQSCVHGSGRFSYPLELYFKGGKSVVQEDDRRMDYILKMDTLGEVIWAKQFFYEDVTINNGTETETIGSSMDSHGGTFVDSSYLYYAGSFKSPFRQWRNYSRYNLDYFPNVFFDREHNDTLVFPKPKQGYVATIIKYNKHTGDYISHISLAADSVGTKTGSPPFVNKEYIMIVASNTCVYNCTYRYDQHTGEMDVYDTIVSSSTVSNGGIIVCDNGFIEKKIWHQSESLSSPNFYIPSNNTNILYYYDSLLDSRRHTPVLRVVEPGNIHVDVLPNPTSGVFSVATDELVTAAEVYNQQGVLIVQKIYGTKSTVFDLRRYPCGVYLLRVYTPKGVAVRKIIRI